MLHDSPLGKSTVYVETYSPDLLFPVPRKLARDKIGLSGSTLPFRGEDIWGGYELSWLNPKGKPEIALAEFRFPCETPNIIESKSFKLYLNSFNNTCFDSTEAVHKTLEKHLGDAVTGAIKIALYLPAEVEEQPWGMFPGHCLDGLDIETSTYEVCPEFLTTEEVYAEETLYSNLLKSNCLATGQPDWGSLLIRYSGPKISHEGLLKYIISYRNHSGFGEYCAEQIFYDILRQCKPQKLTVYARYTRRGGLDINSFRSNFEIAPANTRLIRQ